MNTKRIKTLLLRHGGPRVAVFFQALHFLYLRRIRGSAERDVRLIPRLIGPGDVAIDAGANGADWTYALARAVGPQGRVYAFEADPYYTRATQLAIRWLGLRSARLFPFGLSNVEEEVPLRVVDADGLRESGLGRIDKTAGTSVSGVERVALKRLDSLAEEHPDLLKTRLFKCDVEGYELFVFQGSRRILETARPFVIFETGHFESQGYTARDLHEFFTGLRYRPFALTSDGSLAPTNDRFESPAAASHNRLLVPEERTVPDVRPC